MSEGIKAQGLFFRVYVLLSPDTSRIGVATSKKLGEKPQRNRFKRQVHEILRANKGALREDLDYVVMVTAKAEKADFQAMNHDLVDLLQKLRARWAEKSESS